MPPQNNHHRETERRAEGASCFLWTQRSRPARAVVLSAVRLSTGSAPPPRAEKSPRPRAASAAHHASAPGSHHSIITTAKRSNARRGVVFSLDPRTLQTSQSCRVLSGCCRPCCRLYGCRRAQTSSIPSSSWHKASNFLLCAMPRADCNSRWLKAAMTPHALRASMSCCTISQCP